MKRQFALIFGAAAIMVSCNRAEILENPADNGQTTFTCDLGETRIAAGDKEGNIYKAIWEANDSLFIVNASDNSPIGVAKLTSSPGSSNGTFVYSGTITDGTSVKVKYGKTTAIAAEQKQANAGAKSLKDCTYAESDAVTVNGGSASFSLVHTAAIVKIAVNSSEFAGAALTAVTLRCMGDSLSATGDYVRTSLATPLTLSSDLQEVWFTAKSGDLSGKTVYVAFDLTSKSGDNYTIPVALNGGKLKANTVNSIKVSALGLDKCVNWYEPKENRLRGGLGYAYGDQNTYLIQCKSGSTYNNGTYAANPDYPESVTINTKARGDFAYVIDPTGATFDFCRLGAIAEGSCNGTKDIYTFRYSDIKDATGVDPTKYEITDNGNYSITVKNTGATAGAPIVIMMKDNKVLWSWTLWNIAADGTKLEAMNFNGAELANLLIGQSSNQSTWTSNTGTSFIHTVALYQWGRTVPVFWQSYWSLRYTGHNNNGNVPALAGPVKMSESFAPGIITNYGATTELTNWSTDKYGDLWGNLNKDTGVKSVYDPCPKGWRVADAKIYDNASEALAAKTLTVTYDKTVQKHGIFVSSDPGVLMINAGYVQAKLGATDDTGRPANNGNAATAAGNGNGRIWTNKISSATANQPRAFMFSSSANATGGTSGNFRTCGLNRSVSAPVRCQKDEDNR